MTSPHTPRTTSKMECLEGIRGFASFAVLVGHIMLTFWPGIYFRSGPLWQPIPRAIKAVAQFPGKFLWDGHAAVSVFFVLSGFVLSLAFFERRSASGLGSSAVRRYPRLMFPILASVLWAYFLLTIGGMKNQEAIVVMDAANELTPQAKAPAGHSHRWLAAYYNFEPSWRDVLIEGTYGAFHRIAPYNLVLWTMPIELIGSFLVFSFLGVFGVLRNRWLIYSIGGGLLLWYQLYYYLDFLIGIALCDLWTWNQQTRRWSLPRFAGLLLVALGLFAVAQKPLAATLIVGGITFTSSLHGFFEWRWVRFLGRISFGLYLTHMPVLCSFGCAVYLWLARDAQWTHHSAAVVAAGVSMVASIVVAWGFYHLVDRPTMHFIRWFDGRLFRPRTTAG